MITRITKRFTNCIDPLITKNREDQDYYNKTIALFASFTATDLIMWFYVLFCYIAFGGWHIVTIGGLIFTVLHSFAPILFYYTQSQILTTILISLTGLGFQTLFCVYSGGVFSPSAIWLSLHPVIVGFFGSLSLIYFSVVLNAIIVFGMYYLGNLNLLPMSVLPDHFRNYMIVTSFVGLDFLVAVFTIAAIKTYLKKNSELQKSKELTDNLIRVLAHDINNPLMVLRHYGQKISKNPEQFNEKVAERLNKSSDDIHRITQSVTLWISHRDGKMKLNSEILCPHVLSSHLQLSFEEKLKEKKITLNVEIDDAGKKFLGDRNAVFYQVFNNLISNAIKFSFEDSKIDLIITSKTDKMEFIVRDYGLGIDNDLVDKVFSIYAATNRKGTKNESGTGFGLPIVGTIIHKLNGSIKIENIKKYKMHEQGTIITVTLPSAT